MRLTMWLCAALLSMLTLPACAGYSKQPSYYFKDEAQLALARAAGDGDIQAMQRALDRGADPNTMGEDGMTPLFWAVTMQPNIEAVRYLLAHGGDPDLVTVDKDAPGRSKAILLYQAYRNPEPAFIEAVLEAGANPDIIVDDDQNTLLSQSMADKRLGQIEMLIKYGADVNIRSKFDYTPLYSAVIGQEYKTALAILNAGGDPGLENSNGKSVVDTVKLFHDRESGEDYRKFVKALKGKGYLDPSF
ncbi:ankyrin repeat domain-containing protein [Modicisalibacter coralii]|uniref:ankyrin repeat domain-containing protein n=1 Tax=Modicisalibacter coralii TaxID=2304602 RepID=UPI00100B9F1F|nr:ankyrin repeat domain-containing protein [Halomonas coralii]